jgi:hypothetical protein
MGAPISDKIRRLNSDDIVIKNGPGHAGFWVNDSDELYINITGTPVLVGTLTADQTAALAQLAASGVTKFQVGATAVLSNETANKYTLYLGAYLDGATIKCVGTNVLVLETYIDGDAVGSVEAFYGQTPDGAVGTPDTSYSISWTGADLFYGADYVALGVPTQFVVVGDIAGDHTVTGIGANSKLSGVILFSSGVPSDITNEFTISDADTINNAGGTDTTGKSFIVTAMVKA